MKKAILFLFLITALISCGDDEVENSDTYVGGVYTDGDVVLLTQKEVDEFGHKCYNSINGSLQIGTWTESNTSIKDLFALNCLGNIEGDLVITGNDSLKSLNGLTRLEEAGKYYQDPPVKGTVRVYNNKNLLDLCALTYIRQDGYSLSENGYNPTSQDFVDGNCYIDPIEPLTFTQNSKESFENELSTQITYQNSTIRYITTKKNGSEELNAILFEEDDELINLEYNATKDTLLIYNNESKTSALRVTNSNEGFLTIENLEINESEESIKVIGTYIDSDDSLNKKTTGSKHSKKTSIFQDFLDTANTWVEKYTLHGKLKVLTNKTDKIITNLGNGKAALINKIKSWKTKETEAFDELEIMEEDDSKDFNIKDTDLFKYLQQQWWEYRAKDCFNTISGDAYYDNCNECVGGDTGKTECIQDCNLQYGGTAYNDSCGECVGGLTGKNECFIDCNGVVNGNAYYDNCNECVGGNTTKTECIQDCYLQYGGTAYNDDCGECVGGLTGKTACFTPICIINGSGHEYTFNSATSVSSSNDFQKDLTGTVNGNDIIITYWHTAGLNKYRMEYYLTINGTQITGTSYYCKSFNGSSCTQDPTETAINFSFCD